MLVEEEDTRETNPMSGTCERCSFPVREEDFNDVLFSKEFTPLMFAAFKGYEECVKDLISAGADVNQADKGNTTVLMWAASGGYSSCVQLLIEAGASVNVTNTDHITPLCAAILGSQYDLVRREHEVNKNTKQREQPIKDYEACIKLIIDAGVERKIVSYWVMEAVLASVSFGNYRSLEVLLKTGFFVNTKSKSFPSPLIMAVMFIEHKCKMKILHESFGDRNKCLQMLLKAGAKVNAVDDKGNTALTYAALNGYQECIKTLLKSGANVNKRNLKGDTALIRAAQSGHSQCVKILLKSGAHKNARNKVGNTALIAAAHAGHHQCVEALLKSKAHTNARNQHDVTALILAADNGHCECIRILLHAGANVNKETSCGTSALSITAAKGHIECVKILLKAGADVNQCNKQGGTPLILAAYFGHSECVETLLKAGANVNKCGHDGYTALLLAAQNGNSQCVEIILNVGDDVNKHSKNGYTALFLSAANGHAECLEILLKAGANVNKGNKDGHTALSMAAASGYSTSVGILLNSGAQDKNNALIDAANNGHYECVDLLIEAEADVHVVIHGRTVLHFCTHRSNAGVVQRLLRAGTPVNKLNKKGCNALTELIKSEDSRHLDMAFLLLAAGETFVKTPRKGNNTPLPVLEELMLKEIKPGLSHLCREAIRAHLLKLNPHENLFLRMAGFKGILPPLLIEYLLYDKSLETKYEHENNNLEEENNN